MHSVGTSSYYSCTDNFVFSLFFSFREREKADFSFSLPLFQSVFNKRLEVFGHFAVWSGVCSHLVPLLDATESWRNRRFYPSRRCPDPRPLVLILCRETPLSVRQGPRSPPPSFSLCWSSSRHGWLRSVQASRAGVRCREKAVRHAQAHRGPHGLWRVAERYGEHVSRGRGCLPCPSRQ